MENPEVITKQLELVRGGVRDSNGDFFTVEALQKAVAAFGTEPKLITKKFSGKTEDIQGFIDSVEVVDQSIMADVRIFPSTPEGAKVKDDWELGMAGRVGDGDVKVEALEPLTRTINNFEITGASMLEPGSKVK